MQSKKNEKTNVMRVLDASGIVYQVHDYLASGMVNSMDVAKVIGEDPDRMFKTLVTVGGSGGHYVFMLPASQELCLKKAAKAVGEKSIEMIKSRELLPLTGYIHGGCSPIGMKKSFPTVIDETATLWDQIIFSAGRVGYMVDVPVSALPGLIDFTYTDLLTQ